MKRLFILVVGLFVLCSLHAQKPTKVLFYNLENFFDTKDDPQVRDEEFTPEGVKQWNDAKYAKKLSNIEKVFFDIAAMDRNYPAVIGVCEVENRSVLEDIVSTRKLAPASYKIVHYDSPEARGVDVAFMYRPDIFKIKGEKAIRTIIPGRPDFRTRDILTMWGDIQDEPFFFMVAHWPSRLGGKEASDHLRMAVAKQMKHIADSVRNDNPSIKIVAMGDFNDDPTDDSIEDGFEAKGKVKDVEKDDYFAPFAAPFKAGLGTLAYGDAWNLFDNIIVSENLLNAGQGELRLLKEPGSKYYGNIFRAPYLFQKEGRYKGYPLRTYSGNNFQGGFSDHLPVYIYIGK